MVISGMAAILENGGHLAFFGVFLLNFDIPSAYKSKKFTASE